MARKPRIHVPGGFYHVILRGNAEQDIFFADDDRHYLYGLLQEGVERFGYRVHAFCAMTNHIHLAVDVGEVSLSEIIQNVSFRYTRWVNRRQCRVGHLFQGRYKAILVQADAYLLALVRYIHLNPVRAAMVSEPSDYPWSGHRAYLGDEILPWLTTDCVLALFAPRPETARARYRQFIAAGLGAGHCPEFHGGSEDGRILGDGGFVMRALADSGARPVERSVTLELLEKRVCALYGSSPEFLACCGRGRVLSEVRGVVGWFASRYRLMSLRELAERYQRDASTLTVAVRKIEEKRRSSREFRQRLETLLQS